MGAVLVEQRSSRTRNIQLAILVDRGVGGHHVLRRSDDGRVDPGTTDPAARRTHRRRAVVCHRGRAGVVRRLDGICAAASVDFAASTSTSSPRRPGASTRPTTRPSSWSRAGHSSRSTCSSCTARTPQVSGATHGLHERGETAALNAELGDPSSSSGHRGADALRPTVVVLEAATQSKAARTAATFGGARRRRNGWLLRPGSTCNPRRRPFSKLPPARGERAST